MALSYNMTTVASSKCLLGIEFCIQPNILAWCYRNMALHIFHCNKEPNDKCAVSHSLENAQRSTQICCALCRSARTLADEHWRGETNRKGGAQGEIGMKTEILEQTWLQNSTHLLFVTKQLRQMDIALTVLHVYFEFILFLRSKSYCSWLGLYWFYWWEGKHCIA